MIGRIAPFFREGWPRMKKDARVLQWPWIAGMLFGPLLVLLVRSWGRVWWTTQTDEIAMIWAGTILFQFIMFTLMSVIVFGHELESRAMETLLSQPIRRSRLWEEKMLVATVFITSCLAWDGAFVLAVSIEKFKGAFPIGMPFALAMVSMTAGPLFSLRARNIFTAFVATLASPYLLFVVASSILILVFPRSGKFDLFEGEYAALLTGCCVFALWLGRRTFLRLEV